MTLVYGRVVRNPSPEYIAAAIELCSYKGGPDDETVLTDAGWERAAGYVSIYCGHGAKAANILKRVGSCVLEITLIKDREHLGVALRIERRAFRGIDLAFKRLDNRGPSMTDEQKAAMRELG